MRVLPTEVSTKEGACRSRTTGSGSDRDAFEIPNNKHTMSSPWATADSRLELEDPLRGSMARLDAPPTHTYPYVSCAAPDLSNLRASLAGETRRHMALAPRTGMQILPVSGRPVSACVYRDRAALVNPTIHLIRVTRLCSWLSPALWVVLRCHRVAVEVTEPALDCGSSCTGERLCRDLAACAMAI